MQHQQHRHDLRGVMMQPAQQPSTRHLVLNVIDAFPRGLRARAVGHPQENPRDELNRQRESQRASPHVTPARAARNILVQRLLRKLLIAGAMIQPVEHFLHATGTLSLLPVWKFWNNTQTSFSFRTSTSNVSSPRGLGLFGSV